MFKYEIGETVRIKRDLKLGDANGSVSQSMLLYKNEIATIISRVTSDGVNYYGLDIDDNKYSWDESVLVIPRGLDSGAQSTQSVSLDTSDLLKELQNITNSINNIKKEREKINSLLFN